MDVRQLPVGGLRVTVLLSALVVFGARLVGTEALATERSLVRRDSSRQLESTAIDASGIVTYASSDVSGGNASWAAAAEDASKCKPYPGRRVVLVTVDTTYVDFFANWLLSAEKVLDPTAHKIVVIAEERAAQPQLERLRYAAGKTGPRFDLVEDEPDTKFLLALSESDSHDAVTAMEKNVATPYGSEGFASLVNRRAKRINRFLSKDCAVLYVDVDTVWLKNPFNDIDKAGQVHDLYLTEDLGASGISRPHKCTPDDKPNYCTCFIYARPTEQAVGVINSWMTRSAKNGDSKALAQPQFNSALCDLRQKVQYYVLPKDKYPSGGALTSHMEKKALFGPSGPAVVHANYRIGHAAKMDFLMQNGLWTLPPAH